MLVESRDPESFAAAIASVLTDPVRRGHGRRRGGVAALLVVDHRARLRRLYADLSVRTPVACA